MSVAVAEQPGEVTKTRRQEYTETTRQALVDAATALFTAHGYAETPIKDVVRSARVTRGALYHHFESKLDLFAVVCASIEQRIAETVEMAVDPSATPQVQVAAALDAFLDACLDPGYRRVVLQEAPSVLKDRPAQQESRLLATVQRMVGDLVRVGAFADLPVEMLGRVIYAAMCEAGHSVADSPAPHRARDEAREVLSSMIRGVSRSAVRS